MSGGIGSKASVPLPPHPCQVISQSTMANLPAGGLLSLRVHVEEAGADSNHVVRAWEAVEGLKLHQLQTPKKLGPRDGGEVSWKDLPMLPLNPRMATAKHVVEVILDCNEAFDWDMITSKMKQHQQWSI